MAGMQNITLYEVLDKLHEKLDEAIDFLEEMELYKNDSRRFRHRLSAYLAATDSVLDVIRTQGKRYAKHIRQKAEFELWYGQKENLFQVPDGTDKTWVYLRAARNDTVHVEQVSPNHLARIDIVNRVHIRDETEITQYNPDGTTTVTQSPLGPVPLPEPDTTTIEKNLWAFQPVYVTYGVNTTIAPPLIDDVVSICKEHIKKLRLLVEECATKLLELTAQK